MSAATDDAIRAATRHVAAAMLPDLTAIADGTVAHIAAGMPELAERDALDLARATAFANSEALLHALVRGDQPKDVTTSPEVMRSTRSMVQHGLSHDAVMRGYRLGITHWCTRWGRAVEEHCPDAALAVPVVNQGTTFLLSWLELVSDRLSAEYRDEAERLAREGSLERAEFVRRVLAGETDVAEVRLRLGYDLTGNHVALVLKNPREGKRPPLESTARTLAASLTAAAPLVVRVDVDTTWCWVPTRDAARLPSAGAPVLAGQGWPAAGPEGFRRSHRQAREALRVAQLAGRPAGTVTHFADLDVAALCSTDPGVCRTFVTETLGPLAAGTEDARRLRTTLAVFFDAGGNFRAAAARLGVHHNTARYRVDQAAALLGQAPGEHRLRLELALHLADRLGLVS
ncbi:PucR family transcriptional regulator [Amycolatopsis tucumanensis]|uniref:Helix-turn-helix domain-containing protein n=1 Tax=Amycolatopsis tucumanensis TaxID=401106 RepID=A0ABP7HGU8_9PSEU|nr:helix-turn-helix domain-containing protein [Amycolatopsis tucumanensis]MCF6423661.1 helix-turn-helix domain-containing protein [Amycolatopsis tucumanensis]